MAADGTDMKTIENFSCLDVQEDVEDQYMLASSMQQPVFLMLFLFLCNEAGPTLNAYDLFSFSQCHFLFCVQRFCAAGFRRLLHRTECLGCSILVRRFVSYDLPRPGYGSARNRLKDN